MKSAYLIILICLLATGALQAGILVKNIIESTSTTQCDGAFTLETSGTAGPFNVTVTGPINQNLTGISGDRVFSNLCPGRYVIRVFNAFGCDVNLDAIVPEGRMTVSITGNRVVCGEAATLQTAITGGVAPFTYLWSNNATTQNLSTTVTGTYQVTVTGSNGKTATASFAMQTAIPKPSLTITQITTIPNCSRNSSGVWSYPNGSGEVQYNTVKDPSQTLTFALKCITTNQAVTPSQGGIIPAAGFRLPYRGDYELTFGVQGASAACTTVYPFTVGCCTELVNGSSTNPAIGVSPVLTSPSTTTSNNGSIQLNPNRTYIYSWEHGPNTPNVSNLGVGQYCVNISDGCGNTQNNCYDMVNCAAASPMTINGTLTHTCTGLPGGKIVLSHTPSTGTFRYLWSNGATTKNIDQLLAGQYCVTVTNSAGCGFNKCFTINNTAPGTVQANTYNGVACTENYTCSSRTVTLSGTKTMNVSTSCQFTYGCSLRPGQNIASGGLLTGVSGSWTGSQCFGPRGCYDPDYNTFFYQESAPYNHGSSIYFAPRYQASQSNGNCGNTGQCNFDVYCGATKVRTECRTCPETLAPGEVLSLDPGKANVGEFLRAYRLAGYLNDSITLALPQGITPFTPMKDYVIFLEENKNKEIAVNLWRNAFEWLPLIREEAMRAIKFPQIANPDFFAELSVWPNPFQSELQVQFKTPQTGESRFTFVDVLGRTILEGKLPQHNQSGTVILQIPESVSAGTYFLNITDGKQHRATFKVDRMLR